MAQLAEDARSATFTAGGDRLRIESVIEKVWLSRAIFKN
jgi:hypothetical protein